MINRRRANCLSLAILALSSQGEARQELPRSSMTVATRLRQGQSRSDFALIENFGQWPCDARFVAQLPDMLVRASPDGYANDYALQTGITRRFVNGWHPQPR